MQRPKMNEAQQQILREMHQRAQTIIERMNDTSLTPVQRLNATVTAVEFLLKQELQSDD